MKIPIFYSSSEEFPGGVSVVYDNNDTIDYPPYNYCAAEPAEGGGGMLITWISDGETDTLDKTYKEISDAIEAGKCCMVMFEGGSAVYYVTAIIPDEGSYVVTIGSINHGFGLDHTLDSAAFASETETGVLTFVEGVS